MSEDPIYIDPRELNSGHMPIIGESTHIKKSDDLVDIFKMERPTPTPITETPVLTTQDALSPKFLKQILNESEIVEIERALPKINEILMEWVNRQRSPEYSKIGILIGGKLFVFRRVSNFKTIVENSFEFDIQIRKNKKWVSEHIPVCKGVLVFAQKLIKEK